jgi:hypothetical protein
MLTELQAMLEGPEYGFGGPRHPNCAAQEHRTNLISKIIAPRSAIVSLILSINDFEKK